MDELGNIISAGKVSKKAKIEILADNKKVIGADETAEDGSFVVFGRCKVRAWFNPSRSEVLLRIRGKKK